jgi:hypothetical protein
VEPLEFTSSGGKGEAFSRQVKSQFLTFYEAVNFDTFMVLIRFRRTAFAAFNEVVKQNLLHHNSFRHTDFLKLP